MTDTRDAYLAARKRLNETHRAASEGDLIALSPEDAAALLRGYPPDADLPKSYAEFDARFVPFLRCAFDPAPDTITQGGITVTPHPDGGAILAATNGWVMMLARDPSAKVSEGGCRLLMPADALDACTPPKPAYLRSEGCTFEAAPPPPWTVPDRVWSVGASLFVVPAGAPPPKDGEDMSGLLWASMIETSNYWRDSDARRLDPTPWWKAIKRLEGLASEPQVLSAPVLAAISKAAGVFKDAQYWGVSDMGPAIAVLPASDRSDLAIVAMKCRGNSVGNLPAWVGVQPELVEA